MLRTYARKTEHGVWSQMVRWVACDECKSWYHLSCTDLDERPGADNVRIYMTVQCALTSKLSCMHPTAVLLLYIMADQSHFDFP